MNQKMEETLKVVLVQTTLHWERPEKNRQMFSDKFDEIPEDTDLIVLPEMFNTGFTMTPEHIENKEGQITLEWMQRKAREMQVAIMGSLPFFENDAYTNRLFFVRPNGNYQQYDKRHTFTLAGEDKVYRSGNDRIVVNFKGFLICPLICYDLRFPVWSRNMADYDVLIYVANWPKPRINAWDTLLRSRAIENMAYCIGVNRIGMDDAGREYVGHSAVYDVLGEQLAFSRKEEILKVTLYKNNIRTNRRKFRFLEDRDNFNLIG
ncbi:nitrilase family protein [Maribacter sp. 2304DJ31-5]|uniref:nitrilase family protein n=1 Tax=Maribacter sp. 2304DJ31-5 TaxID=3386273 RepID=UPI0039BD490C